MTKTGIQLIAEYKTKYDTYGSPTKTQKIQSLDVCKLIVSDSDIKNCPHKDKIDILINTGCLIAAEIDRLNKL